MFKLSIYFPVAIAAIVLAAPASAKDYEITQKDKKFSQSALTVKIGDVVNFKNEDAFAHNIFSLSDIKTFDLGSYPKGQSKPVTFDKQGQVEIECAIHPDMKIVVDVKK